MNLVLKSDQDTDILAERKEDKKSEDRKIGGYEDRRKNPVRAYLIKRQK